MYRLQRRVKVTLNCVADTYHKPSPERVVEFSWIEPTTNQFQGGLIAFYPRTSRALRVDLYRLENVKVLVGQNQTLHMSMILNLDEQEIIVWIGDAGKLDISRCTAAYRAKLMERGLIDIDPDGNLILTKAGQYLYLRGQRTAAVVGSADPFEEYKAHDQS